MLLGQLTANPTVTATEAGFTKAQQAYIDQRIEESKTLKIIAEAYMKFLFRNNAKQGCVTYGNPHPRGDNYTGDNGACPEFGLTIEGNPTKNIKGGFRLQSRFGQDFGDWFETGDRREIADASGESLGQNHAAPIQLRGIFLEIKDPIPGIDWALFGTSGLDYWDAWTVGRARFIDRFNGKGIFLRTQIGNYVEALVARIAMAKLFGTANYSVLEEDLVTNPFWARDAIYALRLRTPKSLIKGLQVTLNANVSLDEEADIRDPDAPGSTNTQDAKDDLTAVAPRFIGANASLTAQFTRIEDLDITALVAASYNEPNPDYVSNLARGGLGFSNIVFDTNQDFAGTLRITSDEQFLKGLKIQAEYFNIGSEYNAVAGSRREEDVLITDGFIEGGQLPTLNVANELIDFHDTFYESAVGWHGISLVVEHASRAFESKAETTFIGYNTNAQDRDMDIFPGFGGFDGYTDVNLFSYANTNDRGRDPRAVYRPNQERQTLIFMGELGYKPSWWKQSIFKVKAKYILDSDERDLDIDADDYDGKILNTKLSVSAKAFQKLDWTTGLAYEYWDEAARSGSYAGGVPQFIDYETTRLRPFVTLRYSFGTIWANYHFEMVKKEISASDVSANYESGLIVRSVGAIGGAF